MTLSQRERTFSERYLSVSSNFANLSLSTAVMHLYHFVALPNSLIKRLLNMLPQHRRIAHIIIDWNDYASVHRFMRVMVALVSQINNCPIDSKAFNEAFEEFAQYITKGKRGRD